MKIQKLFQMVRGKPVEVPVDETTTTENAAEYSPEEKVVGIWIDGRPIYRKSWFNVRYGTLGALIPNIDVSALNIDKVISIDGIRRPIGSVGDFAQASNMFAYYEYPFIKSTMTSIVHNIGNGKYNYITIDYTKR